MPKSAIERFSVFMNARWKIRAGRKIEQSSGATAPHRFTDEVTLLRTIPACSAVNLDSAPMKVLGIAHILVTK
jgi:hypothetical protein